MSKKKTHWLQSICENCSSGFEYYPKVSTGRFCSNTCSGEYKRTVTSLAHFEAGTLVDRGIQKRFVSDRDGYHCSECNLDEWRGKKIVLILDHINGDPSNNLPANLRLLCPNCDSQMPTFSGRNRGNGRKSRGISLRWGWYSQRDLNPCYPSESRVS